MPPTFSPVAEVTLSPTLAASPAMEKIWDTNGSPNDFHLPTELALDAQGNIYVIDGGNHRVQKFDQNGNFLLTWGSQGAGDGQFFFQAPPPLIMEVSVSIKMVMSM